MLYNVKYFKLFSLLYVGAVGEQAWRLCYCSENPETNMPTLVPGCMKWEVYECNIAHIWSKMFQVYLKRCVRTHSTRLNLNPGDDFSSLQGNAGWGVLRAAQRQCSELSCGKELTSKVPALTSAPGSLWHGQGGLMPKDCHGKSWRSGHGQASLSVRELQQLLHAFRRNFLSAASWTITKPLP